MGSEGKRGGYNAGARGVCMCACFFERVGVEKHMEQLFAEDIL